MQLVKKANECFRRGDFAGALRLYRQAISSDQALAATLSFNMEQAKRKIAASPDTAGAAELEYPNLLDLYAEVSAAATGPDFDLPGGEPPVSVVVTAHNVEQYIEECIVSLCRQTYGNLEIIVVDDFSSDNTAVVLDRLKITLPRLSLRRLNTNLGTYFAKNYGVMTSSGAYLFFQDGDDISHPDRIRLSMREFMQDGISCVRGCYSRVLYPEGRVLPVNGLVKKLGLITIGVKREVFSDIGLFNSTSKASDDEFFNRLVKFYGKGAVRDHHLPLYYNTVRDGSLFADMIANDPKKDNAIEQRPSPSRSLYVESFQKVHNRLKPEEYRDFFVYPVIRDLIPVAPDMTNLENPRYPVIANVCSIPEREGIFEQAIDSIAGQVDAINIYLDRYETIPKFLEKLGPKASVVLSRDFPGLRDNGKFLPFGGIGPECYYFTIDDDILYPPDYVQAMIRKIEYYERSVVVGVYGVLVPDQPAGYFNGYRRVYPFTKMLEKDALVNILGTGTVAFFSSLLMGLDHKTFINPGMVDLYLSVACKNRAVPMVAVSRPEGWLKELGDKTVTLYEEFRNSDEKQTDLLKANAPWGYQGIREAVESAAREPGDAALAAKLNSLVPLLHYCTL